MIQKQKPQRNAEADCLVDNCEHYTTTNRITSTVEIVIAVICIQQKRGEICLN